jgi:hypothetical protein
VAWQLALLDDTPKGIKKPTMRMAKLRRTAVDYSGFFDRHAGATTSPFGSAKTPASFTASALIPAKRCACEL